MLADLDTLGHAARILLHRHSCRRANVTSRRANVGSLPFNGRQSGFKVIKFTAVTRQSLLGLAGKAGELFVVRVNRADESFKTGSYSLLDLLVGLPLLLLAGLIITAVVTISVAIRAST